MPIGSANPPELFTLEDWKGLNQQSSRSSIDDQEEWWNENFFAIGPGNLRTCWGHGPSIYNAPSGTTILRIFFGFIGYPTPQFAAPGPQYGGRLGWMFLSDGNVDQVDLDQGIVTRIGQIWEPIAPQYWASAVVWRPRFFGSVAGQVGGVLFGSPAGLYAWDGSTLSSPGDPAPDWLTDAQEQASPGGPFTMPVGLPGIYAMEVYQSRLFVAGKDVISFSAPSNGADFSTADGGGSIGYFGNKLTYSYMDLAASAGYLYCFGDSSTDLISNITLTGSGTVQSPYVTNFNYQNIDPQVGQGYPRPVGRFGNFLVMVNGAPFTGADTTQLKHRGGIYVMEGAQARPIGNKVTNLFNTADTTVFCPTVAAATMFGFRVILLNARMTDPFGITRSLLLMWHPVSRGAEFWSVASQNLQLTQIGNYEQDSIITPYGTDGRALYELFAQPDPTLLKRLSTKAFRGTQQAMLTIKNFSRLYCELWDKSSWPTTDPRGATAPLPVGVSITGTATTRGGGVPNGTEAFGFELVGGRTYTIDAQPLSCGGISVELDMQSLSPDFVLERLHISGEQRTLFGA
jgi:hypothetical protein